MLSRRSSWASVADPKGTVVNVVRECLTTVGESGE
jgi:hypothetical protein